MPARGEFRFTTLDGRHCYSETAFDEEVSMLADFITDDTFSDEPIFSMPLPRASRVIIGR